MTTELLFRHDADLPDDGRVLERPAVKGVALRGRTVLLLRSGGEQPRWLQRELGVLRLVEADLDGERS